MVNGEHVDLRGMVEDGDVTYEVSAGQFTIFSPNFNIQYYSIHLSVHIN